MALPVKESNEHNQPSWLRRHVVRTLSTVSRQACLHPLYILTVTALLASTTYTGLLEGSVSGLGRTRISGHDNVNLNSKSFELASFLQGSTTLSLGEKTGWQWQVEEDPTPGTPHSDSSESEWALMTFVFQDHKGSLTVPSLEDIVVPGSVDAQMVSSTPDILSAASHDVPVVFLVPHSQLGQFLSGTREITTQKGDLGILDKWIMNIPGVADSSSGSETGTRFWISHSVASLLELLKHAKTMDIAIMVVGYMSMHLTFISLFMSMRHLGSRFWLAATVLLSGLFSFIFGLAVTTRLGVPVNMALLSEGLPFLVVTIGFEKPIVLTRAVLRASTKPQQRPTQPETGGNRVSTSAEDSLPPSIPESIQLAIHEEGFRIVRNYAAEIATLAAGAAYRGIPDGLAHFCFLAGWILFFDCILLFTFYTTILCVKLEVSRIRSHAHTQQALEDDGIHSRGAAADDSMSQTESSLDLNDRFLGWKMDAASSFRFKFLMIGGFVLFNILNLSSLSYHDYPWFSFSCGTSRTLAPRPIDPFKVAGNGLREVYASVRSSFSSRRVTVLQPVTFAFQSASMTNGNERRVEYVEQLPDVSGARSLGGLLANMDDPILRRWVIALLILSLVLNSYLIKAMRWGITTSDEVTAAVSKPTAETIEQPLTRELVIIRTEEELDAALRGNRAPLLEDDELVHLCLQGKIPGHALEKIMEEQSTVSREEAFRRAIEIRRAVVSRTPSTMDITRGLETSKLPYTNYNYTLVHGACCENVIGYLPLPLGVAGPLDIDGQSYWIPMATTEGVLVASANRGCKAINAGGGATMVINGDGMTRGPCVGLPSLARAAEAKQWIDSEHGRRVLTAAFNSTSRFARLQGLKSAQAGNYLYIRFKSTTGDAMGMNMISKGVEKALEVMKEDGRFSDMAMISVTGNYCVDKKAAAINWIDGRGKSVVAEAMVPGEAVRAILKTSVETLVEMNTAKNLIGSAMAGSIGGFNAHASNLVQAVFLATGQDPAQNVESSNCITIMKNVDGNLHISVSMPSIEVGTIGGGAMLEAQSAILRFLGIQGAHSTNPGDNSRQLARIVAAAVLAGELSCCAALAAGHLVKAHMAHNRVKAPRS